MKANIYYTDNLSTVSLLLPSFCDLWRVALRKGPRVTPIVGAGVGTIIRGSFIRIVVLRCQLVVVGRGSYWQVNDDLWVWTSDFNGLVGRHWWRGWTPIVGRSMVALTSV